VGGVLLTPPAPAEGGKKLPKIAKIQILVLKFEFPPKFLEYGMLTADFYIFLCRSSTF
jgi:hypothetical protein